jgi:hypothetical protein
MRTRFALFLFLALPFLSSSVRAQSPSPDSRTLESILEELHKLRQELQTTSAASQRAQILLYRVRLQMDTVDHLNQRLEQARRQVAVARNEVNHFLEQKKRDQDALNENPDPAKRKALEDDLALTQQRLEQIKDNQPDAEGREAAVASDLRNEQAKLGELQDQLDRLDKQLANSLPPPTGAR